MTAGDQERDLDRRLAVVMSDAGPKRMRTLARLLEPLLNPMSYETPETPEEYREMWLACPSIPLGKAEAFLKRKRLAEWQGVVGAILGIEGLGFVVARQSVHNTLRQLVAAEVLARLQERSRTAACDLVPGFLRDLLAGIDWFTFFFVLEGVELSVQQPVKIGGATLCVYSDEVIAQITSLRTPEQSAAEFSERATRWMVKHFKDRVGLSFRCPGDPERAREMADVIAKRCVAALRFACCVLYERSENARRFTIDIATDPLARRRYTLTMAGRTGGLTRYESLVRALQPLVLSDETLGMLRRRLFEDLLSICCSTEWNELDGAIAAAVEWFGDAQGDPIPSAAYTKYWIALETLLAPPRDGVTECIRRSIPVVLANGCYQFIEPDQMHETAKHVADLYDRRCKAVHQGLREVNPGDLAAVKEYATQVLLTYLALRRHGYESHKAIARETERLYQQSLGFVRLRRSGAVHRKGCSVVRQRAPEELERFETLGQALAAGGRPCKRCRPQEP